MKTYRFTFYASVVGYVIHCMRLSLGDLFIGTCYPLEFIVVPLGLFSIKPYLHGLFLVELDIIKSIAKLLSTQTT